MVPQNPREAWEGSGSRNRRSAGRKTWISHSVSNTAQDQRQRSASKVPMDKKATCNARHNGRQRIGRTTRNRGVSRYLPTKRNGNQTLQTKRIAPAARAGQRLLVVRWVLCPSSASLGLGPAQPMPMVSALVFAHNHDRNVFDFCGVKQSPKDFNNKAPGRETASLLGIRCFVLLGNAVAGKDNGIGQEWPTSMHACRLQNYLAN